MKEPAERVVSTAGTLEVVVRGVACVLGGLVGLLIGRWLVGPVLTESINLVYLTLLGLLLGYLLSARLVGPAERTVRWFQRLSPDAVLAAGVGRDRRARDHRALKQRVRASSGVFVAGVGPDDDASRRRFVVVFCPQPSSAVTREAVGQARAYIPTKSTFTHGSRHLRAD